MPGQVMTRTMLLEKVWDYQFDPQTNVIDVHISRLRQKIDRGFEQPLIHTVRGAGYSLRAPDSGCLRPRPSGWRWSIWPVRRLGARPARLRLRRHAPASWSGRRAIRSRPRSRAWPSSTAPRAWTGCGRSIERAERGATAPRQRLSADRSGRPADRRQSRPLAGGRAGLPTAGSTSASTSAGPARPPSAAGPVRRSVQPGRRTTGCWSAATSRTALQIQSLIKQAIVLGGWR